MKNILITGAGGYIGQHLIQKLLQKDYNLKCISRRNKPAYFTDLEWYQIDLCHNDVIADLTADCDIIVHLACSDLESSFTNPNADFELNTLATINILRAAKRAHVQKFIYTSTAQVYGSRPSLPTSEDMPTNPVSPYAISKRAAEMYCGLFSRLYGFRTIVLRLFNVYGTKIEQIKKHSVETKFIDRVVGNEPIIVHNSQDSRDFIHISDVIKAIESTISADIDSDVINIGSGEEIFIFDLATKIKGLMNSTVEIEIRSSVSEFRMQADISKAKRLLHFVPEVKLEDGLLDLIKSRKYPIAADN